MSETNLVVTPADHWREARRQFDRALLAQRDSRRFARIYERATRQLAITGLFAHPLFDGLFDCVEAHTSMTEREREIAGRATEQRCGTERRDALPLGYHLPYIQRIAPAPRRAVDRALLDLFEDEVPE